MSADAAQGEVELRLVDLETRLAFQEHALLELSDALAAARDEEARTTLLLHRALEELRQLRMAMSSSGPAGNDAASEPPPPHY